MATSGIYRIRAIVNDHAYYGSSVDIDKRWKRHLKQLRSGCHFNPHLQFAWQKYGEENFVFELVEQCDVSTKELRNKMEHPYIQIGEYNVSKVVGGGTIFEFTDEIKSKLKSSWTPERKSRHIKMATGPRNQEFRDIMKAAWTPEKRALQAEKIRSSERTFSEAGRANIALSNRTRTLSAETRAKMSASAKLRGSNRVGCKHTEDTKRLLAEKAKEQFSEKGHPMSGKTHSQETRDKISNTKRSL